jgi:hypothetical protein
MVVPQPDVARGKALPFELVPQGMDDGGLAAPIDAADDNELSHSKLMMDAEGWIASAGRGARRSLQ